MKIQHQSKTKLILGGVAGTLRWMIALALIGGGIVAAFVSFGWILWKEEGAGISLFPIGIGTLVGLALFGMGVAQLFSRERLVLDWSTGWGAYESNSPLVTTEKPFKFKIGNVSSVVITIETVETSVAVDVPVVSEVKICKAVMRVNKPRRAVILDETQNGRTQRVSAVAEKVAGFLGKTVERG
ncbi:MAG: hypothetical protein L7U83_03750 [Akkermansiaceae bacterium]|nr:hypothetical protein [Akkermansiaceae bacterium]